MKILEFAFPADCVMLTDAAGKRHGDALDITAIIRANPGRNLHVNGVPCIAANHHYTVKVTLNGFKNILTVTDSDTQESVSITVYYLKDAHKKYRFSLDDNIWFLQNIAKNKDVYKSVFEDPYLTLLKTMHDRYKTKFHVNIYYECPEFGGFNLTEMPDKFKGEWIENSDWLRFSFHANANLPDRPYAYADYAQVKFEHERVAEQIRRFAGEEAFAGPVTTVHFGEATEDTVRALRDCGIRAMVGSFRWGDPKNVCISYHLNAEQCALMNTYGFLYDRATDMVFFKYGGGSTQKLKLHELHDSYDRFCAQIPLYTFREFCVHEQYFYPHYRAYMPDYYERFDTAIRWAVEHGYEPAFVSEIIDFDQL